MRRRNVPLIAVLVTVLLLAGSCRRSQPVDPTTDVIKPAVPSPGEVHTALLKRLYDKIDAAGGPNGASASGSEEDLAYEAAYEVALTYGEKPLTREQVSYAIEMGREMAQQDPVDLVRGVLSPEELRWWNEYSFRATPENAWDVYRETCATYGTPRTESNLATLCDITLSSAEFWMERHSAEEPLNQNPKIPPIQLRSSWRQRLLRFTMNVVVDGVSGTLAAGSMGGATGIVGGVVIGGLASHGADCLVFGCDNY